MGEVNTQTKSEHELKEAMQKFLAGLSARPEILILISERPVTM